MIYIYIKKLRSKKYLIKSIKRQMSKRIRGGNAATGLSKIEPAKESKGLTKLELDLKIKAGLYYPKTMCLKDLCNGDKKHLAFYKVLEFKSIDDGKELHPILEKNMDSIYFSPNLESCRKTSILRNIKCEQDATYRVKVVEKKVIKNVKDLDQPKLYETTKDDEKNLTINVLERIL